MEKSNFNTNLNTKQNLQRENNQVDTSKSHTTPHIQKKSKPRYTAKEAEKVKDPEEAKRIDISVKKIQKFFKKVQAGRIFKETGAYTRAYGQPQENTTYQRQGNITAYENMQKISDKNIQNMLKELGGGKSFTASEEKLFIKILTLPPARVQHQTKSPLTGKILRRNLHLRSYRFLQQEKIEPKDANTLPTDTLVMKNDDFVFFTVDFSGKNL